MSSLPVAPCGLYIHIPFCRRTCFYCHFVKHPYQQEQAERYITALSKEISMCVPRTLLDTIYIGGGSPALLPPTQLNTLITAVKKHFSLTQDLEFTIEVNPEDVSLETLHFLKESGINRLSIGTQSFVQPDLDFLKRTHSASQSLAAVSLALKSGFTNINIDFIIHLPRQTRQNLSLNFALLREYRVPHVSAYILEDVKGIENNEDTELYFFTREQLALLGYEHYEVSNYCLPRCFSRHNMKYWTNAQYIGVGLSASGFENGLDYKNTTSFPRYYSLIEAGQKPRVEINQPNAALRKIITGLRLVAGIPVSSFQYYPEETTFLLNNGILVEKNGNIAVHPDKILLLNEILSYYFS